MPIVYLLMNMPAAILLVEDDNEVCGVDDDYNGKNVDEVLIGTYGQFSFMVINVTGS